MWEGVSTPESTSLSLPAQPPARRPERQCFNLFFRGGQVGLQSQVGFLEFISSATLLARLALKLFGFFFGRINLLLILALH